MAIFRYDVLDREFISKTELRGSVYRLPKGSEANGRREQTWVRIQVREDYRRLCRNATAAAAAARQLVLIPRA